MATTKFSPKTSQEVAAAGLRTAIKLLVINTNKDQRRVEEDMARNIHCSVQQLRYYAKNTGLPKSLVPKVVDYMKDWDVPFAGYQLQPTKAILTTYGIRQ